MKCPECGAFRNKSWVDSERPQSDHRDPAENISRPKAAKSNGSSSLIAFPGTTRSTVPEWRKELGDRVREVQERRAREAALEREEGPLEDREQPAPPLELLPKAELPQVNPLVAAALQRIERAHVRPQYSGNVAVATVQDYEAGPELGIDVSLPTAEPGGAMFLEEEIQLNAISPPAEKVHNLAVVPAPPITGEMVTRPRPRRLIRDDNDPALNYLDSLPTTIGVDVTRNQLAPILSRIVSGFVDLFVICLLASPLLALVQFNELDWLETRTIVLVASFVVAVGFLYLTISTALTGRTLGMTLFSLRVVDARTGLIPTGGQSAKRALVYILSLAPAGIALMYTFIDREGLTPHDRFSRTAVVRV
jgi:uncharacterized RDD family membrane protein YckC